MHNDFVKSAKRVHSTCGETACGHFVENHAEGKFRISRSGLDLRVVCLEMHGKRLGHTPHRCICVGELRLSMRIICLG